MKMIFVLALLFQAVCVSAVSANEVDNADTKHAEEAHKIVDFGLCLNKSAKSLDKFIHEDALPFPEISERSNLTLGKINKVIEAYQSYVLELLNPESTSYNLRVLKIRTSTLTASITGMIILAKTTAGAEGLIEPLTEIKAKLKCGEEDPT